ncbi:MAG: lysozyme inhibitor LprI family protein, partial [Pseudomonadota bacterium]
MKHWIAACLLVTAGPALAQENPWNCDEPGNLPQQGMNMCAYQDWQRADRALNVVWPKVAAWAKNNDALTAEFRPELAKTEDNLRKAQRAWIAYRDGHCETEGLRYAGGSIAPLIVNSCKASVTRKRT